MLGLALLLTLGCTKKSELKAKRGGRNRGPVAVQVVAANEVVAPRVVDVIGALEGRSQADVYSKVVGRIERVELNEGDAVRAGQVLFRVDRSDPGESYLSVPIVSPISGWVGRWNISVGNQITTQDAVVTVVDDRALRAELELVVDDWLQVSPSTHISFSVGDQHRDGRVLSIARSADPISGRGKVIAEFQNSDRKWKSGMVGHARLELDPKKRMFLPTSAVTLTDAGPFVYLVDEGKAQRKKIAFELVNNDTIEVASGIQPGQDVVVSGANRLSEGAAVKIQEKHGETEEGDTEP